MRLENREKPSNANHRTYLAVWVGLIILTGITVSVAGRNLGRWSIAFALAIAAIKAGLVLNYFMHLKYEKGIRLFKWMIPGIMILFVLLIGLTFFDVAFR
jgi:cytochrome c oxidase subunit 4